jgi:Flp pilus assembly pilin Flp
MVEYGLLLFVILVIVAVALKILGITLQHKFGQAEKHVAGQGEQTAAAGGPDNPNYGNTSAAAASASARAAASKEKYAADPTATGGDKEEQPSGLPLVARFALIALGVIGAAAAFFAMKGNKGGAG